MLVVHTSVIAKPGCSPQVLALMKEWVELVNRPYRILNPNSESNTFIWEMEFESLAEMEKMGNEWQAMPGWLESNKKLDELRVGHYTQEIFWVME